MPPRANFARYGSVFVISIVLSACGAGGGPTDVITKSSGTRTAIDSADVPATASVSSTYNRGGKEPNFGYISKKGLFKISPRFFTANNFSEDAAAVVTLNRDGERNLSKVARLSFIKSDGSPAFKQTFEIPLTVDHVLLDEGSRASYEDEVSKDCYFSEGLAPVPTKSGEKFLWGFIDHTGTWSITPRFLAANAFHEGLAAVCLSNRQQGFVNRNGKIVINIERDKSQPVDRLSKGVGYPNRGIFGLDCGEFSCNLAAVYQKSGGWGYVDKNGRFVIPPQYQRAKPFSPEGAWVVRTLVTQKKAEVKGEVEASTSGPNSEAWCLIDRQGKYLLNGQEFREVGKFSEGLAKYQIDNQNWGYIDKSGKTVLKLPCKFASSFRNGLACVGSTANEVGFIDKTGKFVITPNFFDAGSFSEELAAVDAR